MIYPDKQNTTHEEYVESVETRFKFEAIFTFDTVSLTNWMPNIETQFGVTPISSTASYTTLHFADEKEPKECCVAPTHSTATNTYWKQIFDPFLIIKSFGYITNR